MGAAAIKAKKAKQALQAESLLCAIDNDKFIKDVDTKGIPTYTVKRKGVLCVCRTKAPEGGFVEFFARNEEDLLLLVNMFINNVVDGKITTKNKIINNINMGSYPISLGAIDSEFITTPIDGWLFDRDYGGLYQASMDEINMAIDLTVKMRAKHLKSVSKSKTNGMPVSDEWFTPYKDE